MAVATVVVMAVAACTPPPPPDCPEPGPAAAPAPVLVDSIPSEPDAEAAPEPAEGARVIDLTHPMHEGMAYWPGGVPFTMKRLADYDQGYRAHELRMGENTGTHVDAPTHFFEGKRSIDQLAPEELVVKAVVLDVREHVAADPAYQVAPADVIAWEERHGTVPEGVLVIANTGWHRRFDDPKAYVNQDAQGVMQFPGYHADAAKLLLERGVAGIGIDTLSIDHGPSKDFGAHKVMLAANKYQLENLANLDALPPTGATVVIGVLPVKAGTQAQARVLALLPAPGD